MHHPLQFGGMLSGPKAKKRAASRGPFDNFVLLVYGAAAHCGGGEVSTVHSSMPVTVTVTVGDPVDVVKVHVAVPAEPNPLRSPLIFVVVMPLTSVVPGGVEMPIEPPLAVQLPVNWTFGTGVPLLLSSFSSTLPPTPLLNEVGFANR